jgi:hypothetical protein
MLEAHVTPAQVEQFALPATGLQRSDDEPLKVRPSNRQQTPLLALAPQLPGRRVDHVGFQATVALGVLLALERVGVGGVLRGSPCAVPTGTAP